MTQPDADATAVTVGREGPAYALADPKAIAQPENDGATIDALEILGESTTQGDIVAAAALRTG